MYNYIDITVKAPVGQSKLNNGDGLRDFRYYNIDANGKLAFDFINKIVSSG